MEQLNQHFGIAGCLHFGEHAGLTVANVTLASATAKVFLYGAHLAEWTPAGNKPVIFLSDKAEFIDGIPIRGGVPICFPWFGPRSDGGPGPSHGFARIQPWQLAFAAMVPSADGDRINLTFTLGPNELSRSLGFDHFRAVYEVTVGATLTLRLTVANVGKDNLTIEAALHTYFAIGDVRQMALTGLEGARYLDKTDSSKEKHAPEGPLRLTGETDRVFPGNLADVTIHDETNQRLIRIAKTGSNTTVIWNPWNELAARLADLDAAAWEGFVCIETANTGTDAVTLKPGESHAMQAVVTVASI
jgi:glucose-6-phosphate 1-epimerase